MIHMAAFGLKLLSPILSPLQICLLPLLALRLDGTPKCGSMSMPFREELVCIASDVHLVDVVCVCQGPEAR